MRAGSLSRRQDDLCQRIWACERGTKRADNAAERVRHRLDVQTVYGGEHSDPGKAGQTFRQRRSPEIHSGTSGLRTKTDDPSSVESYERAARLPYADGPGGYQHGLRIDGCRRDSDDSSPVGAVIFAVNQLEVLQH